MGVSEGFRGGFSGAAVDAKVVPRGTGGAAGDSVDGGYGVIDLAYVPT